jgi:peptide/nickel transport system substrate-binding protein
MHLKQPAIFLPWNFSCATGSEGMILPKKYFQQIGADGFARAPIGSGPYRVAKNTIGSAIQLEALDQHWRDGIPKFKTVTFMLVPEESTRIAQLRTGEADVIAISREKVPEVKAAGFNVFSKLNDQVVAVYMQQQWDQVPVADKRVLQALNLALDKDAIMKFVFAGQGCQLPCIRLGPMVWRVEPMPHCSHTPTIHSGRSSSWPRRDTLMASTLRSILMSQRTCPS